MPAQPAAFFAADGYYNTAPGSTLSLVIQPNYYSAAVRTAPHMKLPLATAQMLLLSLSTAASEHVTSLTCWRILLGARNGVVPDAFLQELLTSVPCESCLLTIPMCCTG